MPHSTRVGVDGVSDDALDGGREAESTRALSPGISAPLYILHVRTYKGLNPEFLLSTCRVGVIAITTAISWIERKHRIAYRNRIGVSQSSRFISSK